MSFANQLVESRCNLPRRKGTGCRSERAPHARSVVATWAMATGVVATMTVGTGGMATGAVGNQAMATVAVTTVSVATVTEATGAVAMSPSVFAIGAAIYITTHYHT